jgi:hypothetical protein
MSSLEKLAVETGGGWRRWEAAERLWRVRGWEEREVRGQSARKLSDFPECGRRM